MKLSAIAILCMASLLLGNGRCENKEVCPTNEELRMAVKDYNDDRVTSAMQSLQRQDPNSLVMVHGFILDRIGDEYCTQGYEPDTVNCKFTARWSVNLEYFVALLSRAKGEWKIVDAKSVVRKLYRNRIN